MATFGECKQFQTVVNLERGKFGLNLRAHASFNRTTNEGGAFTAAPAQNPSPRWIHKVRSPARQAMQADVAVLGMGRRSVIGVPPLHHQSRCRASKDHRCHAGIHAA
jgi:hypothetical protein